MAGGGAEARQRRLGKSSRLPPRRPGGPPGAVGPPTARATAASVKIWYFSFPAVNIAPFRSGAPVICLPQEAQERKELICLLFPTVLSSAVVTARQFFPRGFCFQTWRLTRVASLPTCWCLRARSMWPTCWATRWGAWAASWSPTAVCPAG